MNKKTSTPKSTKTKKNESPDSSFLKGPTVLLSQIKMTLMTPNRSVLGEAAYGIDEDNYLFEFSEDFDIVNVEEQVRSQLEQYCTLLKNRDWEAKAYLVTNDNDQYRDAVHVVLSVDKNTRFVIAYE
jgi:hypothetical protein